MQSFQLYVTNTSILHIIMHILVAVLLKSSKDYSFYRDFDKAFDSQLGKFYSVDVGV